MVRGDAEAGAAGGIGEACSPQPPKSRQFAVVVPNRKVAMVLDFFQELYAIWLMVFAT